ncbi:RuvC-like resolvase [Mycobacterium phage Onyinye]|uniref:RuvC-like resolvase n=1 Tax=Mycobacterium phage Onyinye TaxID=2686235 RepID=A0A6B9LDE7_9CAUD|nr:RuvC-like resolvase [Mycobacterium phage Onyinye]QHB37491.1 RuvC-like resolvase [Mycobacterium phage Onyinye]
MGKTIQMRGIQTIDLAKRTRRRRGYIKDDEITYDSATVIALDPGGTTGWSLISVHPEALTTPDASILDNIFVHQHGQVDCGSHRGNLGTSLHSGISTDGEFSGVYDLAKFIHSWPCAAVVIEDFVLRTQRMDRDLLSPVRVTSAVGYSLWRKGRDYHVQSPADAKRTCTDERLKEWKMYDPYGGLRHARDADRHAILFLRRAKAKAAFRANAWPHLYGERGVYAAS